MIRSDSGSGKGEARWTGRSSTICRPFRLGQIQLTWFQWAVAAGRAFHRANAVLVIILDRLAAAFQRLIGRGVADDEVAIAEMVEQGLQTVLEQRQPMLHARHPAPFRYRLVERILRRGRAEFLAIAGTEALDAVGVEQRLGRGHQDERLGLVGRTLIGGIEPAQAVDLVAEEIEPQRQLFARREDVDQRSANGIFAMLGDGVGALITERVELPDQRFAVDPLAFRDAPGQLADAEGGQQALRRGAGGRDQQLRLSRASPAAR